MIVECGGYCIYCCVATPTENINFCCLFNHRLIIPSTCCIIIMKVINVQCTIVWKTIIAMKKVMLSSFNFNLELSSDVSARCSSHPQGENG